MFEPVHLPDRLTRYIMYPAKPYMSQIDILTGMKGISVITAIALIADISNLKLRKWYQTKIDQAKKRGKVRMAVCRRVFTEIFQMLKKKEYHHYRNERNHAMKMQAFIKFLNNYSVPEKHA